MYSQEIAERTINCVLKSYYGLHNMLAIMMREKGFVICVQNFQFIYNGPLEKAIVK